MQIETFAAIGLTKAQIAPMLGISGRLFSKWLVEDPRVEEAIARGRAKGNAGVGHALYKKALAGDVTAIIWYEKTRARRTDRVEVVNEDRSKAITRMIGMMTEEQLKRVAAGESPEKVAMGMY